MGCLLAFLQAEFDMRLALITFKDQISVLAVFFQRPIAAHFLVHTFVQGVRLITPPDRPPLTPWDLNLVLSVL